MIVKRLLGAVLLCVFFLSGVALAQVVTGTISGTVSDSTGAVIPGASVSILNVNTGISRTVTTDAAGLYRVPQLGLGDYEVAVESAGFQTSVRSGITLTVGREAVVDFTLQVGAVTERVTVTGEAPLIDTRTATVANLMDEGTMRDLPLLGRSMFDLTSLQPGVIADLPIGRTGITGVFGGGGGVTKRVIAGRRPQDSTYLLDGIETNTPSFESPANSVLGEQLGIEAIQEFTLLQNNFGAQYGRASGGVVNAVTKSGTNQFHGSVFEFLRNEKMDARDYFSLPSDPKAPLKRNQFGAALGGPIQSDRTFFFLNYEGLRIAAADPELGFTLTPQTRLGRITNNKGEVVKVMPVHPDIQPVLDLIPLPTPKADGTCCFNFQNNGAADFFALRGWTAKENYYMGRIDQQISDNDSLFGRLTMDRSERLDDLQLLTPEPYKGIQRGSYWLVGLSETHIFSPTVLNTIRLGFTRHNAIITNSYLPGGDQFPEAPGLDPRLNLLSSRPWGNFGRQLGPVRLVNATGYAFESTDNMFDFKDTLMINRGRHSITLGGEVKRLRMNPIFDVWAVGFIRWRTIEALLTNEPFDLVQVLRTGEPGNLAADVNRGWRQTAGAWHIEDAFTVMPNLTLNLGLRWEKISGPKEVNGKLGQVLPNVISGTISALSKEDTLFAIDDGMKGFSPRVGVAWTPFAGQKTVLRGGFGLFKNLPRNYDYMFSATVAPPVANKFQIRSPKFPFPYRNADGVDSLEGIPTSSSEPVLPSLNISLPYSVQWTASLEQQLGETLVVKLNYLGSHGVHGFAIYNPLQPPAVEKDGRAFMPTAPQSLNPNLNSIRYVSAFVDQHYHQGQVVVEKRMRSGLRFNSSYTWSKNIDNGGSSGTQGNTNISGTTLYQYNNSDFGMDKSLSALHVAHNFISSYTYELPVGTGRAVGNQWSGLPNHILGGWTVNGSGSLRTGIPVNIGMTPRQTRPLANGAAERPDLIAGGNNNPVLKNWTPERYYDVSQFKLQPPGFFGNLGRNTLIRPGIFNLNFSLAKNTALGETASLAFRAEFFNLLNRPNFGTPGARTFRNTAGSISGSAGRITSLSAPMRRMQFGLKLTF